MNPLFSQLLGGAMGGQQGMGSSSSMQQLPMPGQEARNMDMSGLLAALGQGHPKSGAIGLPQQIDQMQEPMVLPDREFAVNGTPPSLDAALLPADNAGMSDPTDWQKPQGSMPINGGVQRQQVSQQGGGATGIPNTGSAPPRAIDIATGQPYAPAGKGGMNWSDFLNPTGTMDNPNAFVRMGRGYNDGGLIGALGYLLTDMSKQTNGTTNQGF